MAKNKTRRADGEGSIKRRRDGRWEGKIYVGKVDGKNNYQSVYGKSKAEAAEKLLKLADQKRLNQTAVMEKGSLAEYLTKWLATDVAMNPDGKANTYRDYELAVRRYIIPYIGGIKLSKLTGRDIKDWRAAHQRDGASQSMLSRGFRVLRAALNEAMREDLIVKNPCFAVKQKRVKRDPVTTLEPEQIRQLVDECQDRRMGDAILLAVFTGMRRGEVFALQWDDWNEAEAVISVRRALVETTKKVAAATGRTKTLFTDYPKTHRSRRMVPLDARTRAALERRKAKAVAEDLGPGRSEYIFAGRKGGPIRASNYNRDCWNPVRKACSLEGFKFHDLRHTIASMMIAANIPMKVISERLGHENIHITMDLYGHLMLDAQAKAAEALDAFLDERIGAS